METVTIYAGVFAFIAIGAGYPMAYMWSAGKFVGQKPPPKRAKAALLGIATFGIGYSTLLAVLQTGFGDVVSLLLAALLAGCGVTGIVALQESFEEEQDAAK